MQDKAIYKDLIALSRCFGTILSVLYELRLILFSGVVPGQVVRPRG